MKFPRKLEARFDAMGERRKALFEAGGLRLVRIGPNQGRMFPDTHAHGPAADEYNHLADLQKDLARKIWGP